MKSILITGGAGYIGSHAVLECLQEGHQVVVFDNLSNSSPESLRRVAQIVGVEPIFVEGDINDRQHLDRVFKTYEIEAVMHFAGLKSVSESITEPISYFSVNTVGTMTLLEIMLANNCFKIVFSSSATVYGTPAYIPLDESHSVGPINPYGQSKLHAEDIIRAVSRSDSRLKACILRYFNPVGCHSSGLIGEDPTGPPSNLVPFLCQVLSGRFKEAKVFGSDYETADGTGVRDFIHVVDLAAGHLKALEYLEEAEGCSIFNMVLGFYLWF